MHILRTKAISLGYKNFRESDRIVYLYSENFGKLEVLARGSRKIKSKLAPIMEPLILGDYMIARGKKNNVLASGVVVKNFSAVRAHYNSLITCLLLLATVNELTVEGDAENNFFVQLLSRLDYVNKRPALQEEELNKIISGFKEELITRSGFHDLSQIDQGVVLYKGQLSSYL